MALNRKSIIIWSAALAILLLSCFITPGCPIFVHDRMLRQHCRKYRAVTHPTFTQRVKYYRELGLLIGNGNHCDLFVGELRSYTGSQRQLLTHYAAQSFWSPLQHRLPVDVFFIENGIITGGTIENEDISLCIPFTVERILQDAKAFERSADKLYIVYMFDYGYEPGLDIRCQ